MSTSLLRGLNRLWELSSGLRGNRDVADFSTTSLGASGGGGACVNRLYVSHLVKYPVTGVFPWLYEQRTLSAIFDPSTGTQRRQENRKTNSYLPFYFYNPTPFKLVILSIYGLLLEMKEKQCPTMTATSI